MTEKVNSPRGAARGKERPQGLSGGVGGWFGNGSGDHVKVPQLEPSDILAPPLAGSHLFTLRVSRVGANVRGQKGKEPKQKPPDWVVSVLGS